MATAASAAASDVPPKLTHAEKTSSDPRAADTYTARITSITQPTPSVRLVDFHTSVPFKFKAGQWVDLYTPNVEQAGGFSIVSSPAAGTNDCTFRLAIQEAPKNPPAAYLWRTVRDVVDTSVKVQVGGQFTFPPVNFRKLAGKVRRITLIAGGIGANPMLSILAAIRDSKAPLRVTMIYGIRNAEEGMYLDDLHEFCESIDLDLRLFVSQSSETQGLPGTVKQRRFKADDLNETLEDEKDSNLYYICGPANMTDFVQQHLLDQGVKQDLVQTERWW